MRRMISGEKLQKLGAIEQSGAEVTLNDGLTVNSNGDVEVGRNLTVGGAIYGKVEEEVPEQEITAYPLPAQNVIITHGNIYMDYSDSDVGAIKFISLPSSGIMDLEIYLNNASGESINKQLIISNLTNNCEYSTKIECVDGEAIADSIVANGDTLTISGYLLH